MEAITRALLVDDVLKDQTSYPNTAIQVPVDSSLESDPMIWDDAFLVNQSPPRDTSPDIQTGSVTREQTVAFDSFWADISLPSDLVATANEEVEFLDNYFLHYHTLYPILHEWQFRSEFKNQI